MSPLDPLPPSAARGTPRLSPSRPRLLVAHRDHTLAALCVLLGEECGFEAVGAYDGWQAQALLASLRKTSAPLALLVYIDLPGLASLQPQPTEPVILLLEHEIARPAALATWKFHDVIVGPPSFARIRTSLARLGF